MAPDFYMNRRAHRSTKKSTKRIEENDLPLLQKWRKSHPTDHRIAFYLSQTLMALRRWEEALHAYSERIALGGYHVSTTLHRVFVGFLATFRAASPQLWLAHVVQWMLVTARRQPTSHAKRAAVAPK